ASSGSRKKRRVSPPTSARFMPRPRAAASTPRSCARSSACAEWTPPTARSRRPSWRSTAGPSASRDPSPPAIMAPPRRSLAPIVPAGLIMIIWGATPVATRLAVADLDPVHVGLLRTVFAGVLALPIALALRQPLPRDRRGFLLLAISGASGFIVFPLLYSVGQRATSAMHGGMILAALPIFTGSYAALVERRRPTAHWIAGCLIALLGE